MLTQINHYNALPKGYQLEEYRIESVLSHEGFNIVYLAHDTNMDVPVSIKEYLPNEIAVREGNYMVQPKFPKDAEKLAWGIKQFSEEARTLARNNHLNIVRVRRFLNANNTIYIIMDHEEDILFPKDSEYPVPRLNSTARSKRFIFPFIIIILVLCVIGSGGYVVYKNKITTYSDPYNPPEPIGAMSSGAILTQQPVICDIPGKKFFRDPLKDGGCGPELAIIPAGDFNMGDIQGGGQKDEQPIHRVSLKSFAMCRYEVTFEDYDRFAEATYRYKADDEDWGRGRHPVINVSWHDAMAYMKWLSEQTEQTYGLPSEAQWEYSARAGTKTKYWWGNTASHEYANYGTDNCCDGLKKGKDNWKYTSPVASFAPNPFGLYDSVGNVWEWVADPDHDDYNGAPEDGSVWEEGEVGDSRVIRGGSWYNLPLYCRVANRHKIDSDEERNRVGFRCYRQFAEN